MIGRRTRDHELTESPTRAPDAAAPGKATRVQQIAQGEPVIDGEPRDERVHAAAEHGVSGPGQQLPHLDRIQALFGRHDVRGVRAHVGGGAAEGAAAMGASAYATGNQVAFGGAPDLHTAAHEAAHVVQQAGGGVQLEGGVGASGDAYEQHADAVADRVVRGESAEALLDQHVGGPAAAPGAGSGVQRLVQRRDWNGPYSGNRPEPSETTDPTYVIHSSANRVLHVGDHVEYRIDQTQATMQAAGSHLGIRWQAINDPAAVQSAGIPATIAGPADQLHWSGLTAQVPGHHVIKAWVSLNGRLLGELTYHQEVVSRADHVQVPPGASASPLATIADFIALVRRVEAAYAGAPWQDIVSRLRKERYPGPGGGVLSGVKASTGWNDLVDEQEDLPPLEVPPVAMADVAAVRRNHVVTTPGGLQVDVGHILAGVDSFNFPGVAGIFALDGMEGPAAATWSGDVGSALVEWAAGATSGDTSDTTKQGYYDDNASPADMLGDVDALGMAHGPNLNLPPTAPLSQRLEAFYQTAPATGQNKRFHNFCRASHFGLSSNQLDAASQARIREQILRFANGFELQKPLALLGHRHGPGLFPDGIMDTMAIRVLLGLPWFTDHFIEWVNAGLTAEGP